MHNCIRSTAILLLICSAVFSQISRLYPLGMISDTTAGVDGLQGAYSIVLSPDGKYAYVGTVTDAMIAWFFIDSTTGTPSYAGKVQLSKPTWNSNAMAVCISPDGKNVYASGGWTWSFKRNPATGALTDRDSIDDAINNAQPNSIRVTPDGRNFCKVSLGGSSLTWFDRDTLTGRLTYRMAIYSDTTGLNRCNAVIVGPDSRNVYVASESDSILSVFAADSARDSIYQVQYFKEARSGVKGLDYSWDIEITSDGKFIYTLSAMGNGIGWFNRNLVTGMLSYGGFIADTGGEINFPITMDITADGKRLYAYGINKGWISSFLRNSSTGTLTYESTSPLVRAWTNGPAINSHSDIKVSKDSRFLYQVNGHFNCIIWYRQNFSPSIDSFSNKSDTLDITEGDSLKLRVYSRDPDPADTLSFIWKKGTSSIGSSDTCMVRTDLQSFRIDSVVVRVTDGFDTVRHKWVLRIANKGIAPVIVRPSNGDTLTDDSLLVWEAYTDPDLKNAVRYLLQIASDTGFSSILVTADNKSGTSDPLRSLRGAVDLPAGVPLYWRIKAHETQGYSYETPFSSGKNWFVYVKPLGVLEMSPGTLPKVASIAIRQTAGTTGFSMMLAVPAIDGKTVNDVQIRIVNIAGRTAAVPVCGQLAAGTYRMPIGQLAVGTYIGTLRIGRSVNKTVRFAITQ